jgi:hypothetical protein
MNDKPKENEPKPEGGVLKGVRLPQEERETEGKGKVQPQPQSSKSKPQGPDPNEGEASHKERGLKESNVPEDRHTSSDQGLVLFVSASAVLSALAP